MDKFKGLYDKIKAFYLKYERIILPFSFVTGFIWDNLTLRRIDLVYENIVFAWNIFLMALVITLIKMNYAGRGGFLFSLAQRKASKYN